MAAIAFDSHVATSTSYYWGGLLTPPGFAQGDEGRLVGEGVARAAKRWQGPSEYVATLFTGQNESARTKRSLMNSGILAICSIAFVVAGVVLELGNVFFPFAGITGLAGYAYFTRWAAKQYGSWMVIRYAERIRRALAYEGDFQNSKA